MRKVFISFITITSLICLSCQGFERDISSLAEEGFTKPALVPCPIELLSLRQEPIELCRPAIVMADKAPIQHLYIAEQIQNDLSDRFGINAVILSDTEDRSFYASYIIIGEPEHFELLRNLCEWADENVNASTPGREGFILRNAQLENKETVIIAGSDAKGVINGGFTFLQLPYQGGEKVYCPAVRILDKPSLGWRGPNFPFLCTGPNQQYNDKRAWRSFNEKMAILDWFARCRYNIVLDFGPFWRDVKVPGVAQMITELKRRGMNVCFAFSIEGGPVEPGYDCQWGYLDTSDEQQMNAFREQCEDICKLGIGMLEIGYGDIPGDLSVGEKDRFKDKYEKSIYIYEEAAKIADKYNIPLMVDSPYYFCVGTTWEAAARYEKMFGASAQLKNAYYLNTLNGGFDETKPDGFITALKHLKDRGLKPFYFINGIRGAFGPVGGYQPHYSGSPRHGVPTIMEFTYTEPFFQGFPYFEQTYTNPKPENLRDVPKVAYGTWADCRSRRFQWMLHATWGWSPERFDELRDREIILDRIFGKGAGRLAEEWQKIFCEVIIATFPEIGKDEPGGDEQYRHSQWYEDGFRCYRSTDGTKVRTEEDYEHVTRMVARLSKLRSEMKSFIGTSEACTTPTLYNEWSSSTSLHELRDMAKAENYILKVLSGYKTSGVLPLEDLAKVERLIKKGIDINIKNKAGRSPLLQAAMEGRLEAFEFLIKHGADMNSVETAGQTALHLAARNGYAEIIQLAKQYKVRLNAIDITGKTPLHLAVVEGHLAATKALLNIGAAVDIKDNSGQTPLHTLSAKYHGNAEIIKILVLYKADIQAADNAGQSPLHLAASQPSSIYTGDEQPPKVLVALLELKPNLEARNNKGETALHCTATNGRLQSVDLLLKLGADIEALDSKGQTPIISATLHDRARMVQLLLQNNAIKDVKDNDNKTAYDYAVGKNQQEVIMLLTGEK